MTADRPCADTVPTLLGKGLAPLEYTRVLHVLLLALTHATEEVRAYAARGIGRDLWGIDPSLALRCVSALATEGALIEQLAHDERRLGVFEQCEAQFLRRAIVRQLDLIGRSALNDCPFSIDDIMALLNPFQPVTLFQ